jgi:hypothetical protein
LVYSQYEEVTVRNGEDIVISVLVTNKGSEPQEDWMTGIDIYKITDYNDPKNTRIADSRVYAIIKYVGTSQIQCRDAHDVPISMDDCYCYIANPIGTEILGDQPEESVNITCVIKHSFWFEKWGLTNGNERITLWVHETVDEWDFDRNGYEWFWDALERQNPTPIMIKTEGWEVYVDVKNLNTNCSENGMFNVTFKITGNLPLENLIVRDELWYDYDGKGETIGDRDIFDYEEKEVFLTSDFFEWSSLQIPDDKTPFYYHNLTVIYQGKIITQKNGFYKAFTCYKTPEYTLHLEAMIDRIGEIVTSCVEIYDENGNYIDEIYFGKSGEISLTPGRYYIKVPYRCLFDKDGREFSHFWDHDCNGVGASLDTGDNSYLFEMYNHEKTITLFYKLKTYITRFNYNGTHITGKVLDDSGYGTLDFFGRFVECGYHDPFHQNLRVDLYFEKDEKWYLIGSPEINYSLSGVEDRDGSFIQEWECFPGVKRIKAVYVPSSEDYANYMSLLHCLSTTVKMLNV